MTIYRTTVYLNTDVDNFTGYDGRHALANSGHTYEFEAADERAAAEAMFEVGNRQAGDAHGATWPSDIRSVSVGDLICIRSPATARVTFLSVDSFGWTEIPEPSNPTTALAGHPRVTSCEGATR